MAHPLLTRRLFPRIEERLNHVPAVILLGPRRVGKTTLARDIASRKGKSGALYLDLKRPIDRRRLRDADTFLRAQTGKLVVIDELQRAPALFETLRDIIDERRTDGARAGLFLLLGPATIGLMRQGSETLAGRVAYMNQRPIDALEFPDIARLWLRGGFPDSVLPSNDVESLNWRRDFIRSYLERDVPMFAPRMPPKQSGDCGRCSRMRRARL